MEKEGKTTEELKERCDEGRTIKPGVQVVLCHMMQPERWYLDTRPRGIVLHPISYQQVSHSDSWFRGYVVHLDPDYQGYVDSEHIREWKGENPAAWSPAYHPGIWCETIIVNEESVMTATEFKDHYERCCPAESMEERKQ